MMASGEETTVMETQPILANGAGSNEPQNKQHKINAWQLVQKQRKQKQLTGSRSNSVSSGSGQASTSQLIPTTGYQQERRRSPRFQSLPDQGNWNGPPNGGRGGRGGGGRGGGHNGHNGRNGGNYRRGGHQGSNGRALGTTSPRFQGPPPPKKRKEQYVSSRNTPGTSQDRVSAIEKDLADVKKELGTIGRKIETVDRKQRILETRFTSIPRVDDKPLKMLIQTTLTNGIGLSAGITTQLLDDVTDIRRTGRDNNTILVTWGSIKDRDYVLKHKKEIGLWNPWIKDKPISINPNYTSTQYQDSDGRNQVFKLLRDSGDYTMVRKVGVDKISVDNQAARNFKEFNVTVPE